MAKTLHYAIHNAGVPGYVMFCFFSFRDGQLHIGQCQSDKIENVPAAERALAANGWTRGDYRYVNGKAVLVQD